MVCRFLESFDYYTADADLFRKWENTGSGGFLAIDTAIKRTGRASFQTSSGFGFADKVLDDQASWVVGFGFRIAVLPTSQITIVDFRDKGTIQCSLRLNTDGTFEVTRGASTAVTDGQATKAINGATWFYVEMKVTIADSIAASSCIVRVNEEVLITVATGQDLKVSANASSNQFRFIGSGGGGATGNFDDVYIFDATGSDNNDFAGDVKVVCHLPNTNGSTSNFVGSDADSTDNYLHVDETDTDEDSTYVESSTPGDIDLYAVDNFVDTPLSIHAVQVNAVVKKVDAGARTMRLVTRPLGTNFFSATLNPSAVDYSNEINIYDLNPESGGVAWSEAGFNDTQFGIEVQA